MFIVQNYHLLKRQNLYLGTVDTHWIAVYVIFSLSNLAEFYIGKQCLLNSGEEGTIAYVDVNYPTRPIVRVGNRFIDLTKDKNIKSLICLINFKIYIAFPLREGF